MIAHNRKVDPETARRMAVEDGLSCQQIGDIIGCSDQAVIDALKRQGLSPAQLWRDRVVKRREARKIARRAETAANRRAETQKRYAACQRDQRLRQWPGRVQLHRGHGHAELRRPGRGNLHCHRHRTGFPRSDQPHRFDHGHRLELRAVRRPKPHRRWRLHPTGLLHLLGRHDRRPSSDL